VEEIEGFIISDLDGGAGEEYDVARNQAYEAYMRRLEGEEGESDW
jgi:hypothetical protein